MARKGASTPISEGEARSRLAEAHVYLDTAELLATGASAEERRASGSNAILAGIAASDALCGLILGERSSGDDHAHAVTLLKRATKPASKPSTSLGRLLTQKTPIQYGVQPVSARVAADLVEWARDVVTAADERAR